MWTIVYRLVGCAQKFECVYPHRRMCDAMMAFNLDFYACRLAVAPKDGVVKIEAVIQKR